MLTVPRHGGRLGLGLNDDNQLTTLAIIKAPRPPDVPTQEELALWERLLDPSSGASALTRLAFNEFKRSFDRALAALPPSNRPPDAMIGERYKAAVIRGDLDTARRLNNHFTVHGTDQTNSTDVADAIREAGGGIFEFAPSVSASHWYQRGRFRTEERRRAGAPAVASSAAASPP